MVFSCGLQQVENEAHGWTPCHSSSGLQCHMAPAPCVAWPRWWKHTHPMVYIRKDEAMVSAPCMTWPRWWKHTLWFTSFFLPCLRREPKVGSFLLSTLLWVFFFFKETYLGGKIVRVNVICLFLSIPSFCPCCMPWTSMRQVDDFLLLLLLGSLRVMSRRKEEEWGGKAVWLPFPFAPDIRPQPPASLWIFRVIAAPTPLATENCMSPWDFTQRITVNGLLFLFACLRVSRVAQAGPSQLRMTLRSHSSCIYLPSA